jgi:hypothetical protein
LVENVTRFLRIIVVTTNINECALKEWQTSFRILCLRKRKGPKRTKEKEQREYRRE